MIDSYDFGIIFVNGRKFDSDLIISKKGITPDWWRKEGHKLGKEDIDGIIAQQPEILIIGSGFSGVLKVPRDVEQYIRSQGIELLVKRTEEACREYNRLCKDKDVMAALHLTC